MRVRRCLNLLAPLVLGLAALAAGAAATAPPAAAGVVTGNVYDAYQNPLGGMLVEALDSATGVPFAWATTAAARGAFSFEMDSPPSGMFKVRVSDPAGVFTTSYLYDHSSFEAAELFGYS
jgi:hypothetical protein